MLTLRLHKTILTIAVLAVLVPVIGAHAQTDGNATEDDSMMMMADLSGTVTIGGLFPLTGDSSSIGEHTRAAAVLAVEDFNAYLTEQGAAWQLEMDSEDTGTAPVLTLEKFQSLHARGISTVVGPFASANINSIINYANTNDMLVLSYGSTAPALAIADDSVYRMTPDDNNQGKVLGKLLDARGIEAVVPIWRGEIYGDGLHDAAASDFESRGGFVHEGVRYNPDAPELSLEVSSLADSVQEMVDQYGADKVAVLVISFDEVLQIVQSASQYDILSDVLWIGAESVAEQDRLVTDSIASEFVAEVDFTAVQILISPGTKYDDVSSRLQERLGVVPNTFSYPAYDAVWVMAKSIMEAGSTDAADVKSVIRDVAATHDGTMASTELNDAGDLALANYQIWRIIDNTWTITAKYSADKDVLSAETQPDDDVTVGSLYPLTGRSSSTGYATREASDLGAADFNTFLQSLGVEWRLHVVAEDSTSLPTIALEKVQTLLTRGIDIIIGPRPSAEVTQVKQYADTNNMMIISCCSTAPTLAIADDSVFRLAVDDVYQGAGVSKMFEEEGIEAVIPIWLGDAYGDGLVNEVISRAESRGYVVSDGIRYEPLLPDFAVSVAALADQVQEQVDEYGADKVAVFMTSFDESVPIMQAASRYDVLSEIKWFGSETFVPKTNILDDPITSELVKTVQFTAMRPADVNSIAHNHVKDHFLEVHGEIPTGYIYSAYDAAWLVGLSILQSGATDAGTIKTVFHDVASTYVGASGNTILNEAGDLTPRNYAIWAIGDDGWMLTDKQYSPVDDTIS